VFDACVSQEVNPDIINERKRYLEAYLMGGQLEKSGRKSF